MRGGPGLVRARARVCVCDHVCDLSRVHLNQIDFIDEMSRDGDVVGVCACFVREPDNDTEVGAIYGRDCWLDFRRSDDAATHNLNGAEVRARHHRQHSTRTPRRGVVARCDAPHARDGLTACLRKSEREGRLLKVSPSDFSD